MDVNNQGTLYANVVGSYRVPEMGSNVINSDGSGSRQPR